MSTWSRTDLGIQERGNAVSDRHTVPDFIHFWHCEYQYMFKINRAVFYRSGAKAK